MYANSNVGSIEVGDIVTVSVLTESLASSDASTTYVDVVGEVFAVSERSGLIQVVMGMDVIAQYPQMKKSQTISGMAVVARHPSFSLTQKVRVQLTAAGAQVINDYCDARLLYAEADVLTMPLANIVRIFGGPRANIDDFFLDNRITFINQE